MKAFKAKYFFVGDPSRLCAGDEPQILQEENPVLKNLLLPYPA